MRPPWPGFHSGVPNPVICGRKFCTQCGRFRHLTDFGRSNQGRIASYCRCCGRERARQRWATMTPERRALTYEYHRFYNDAARRRAGVPQREHHRPTVIDQIERIFLPRDPFVLAIRHWMITHPDATQYDLVRRMGGSLAAGDRALRRIRSGESAHVRIDVADRIAMAVGIPLEVLCPYTAPAPITYQKREAA
jgi:hypothetical protein